MSIALVGENAISGGIDSVKIHLYQQPNIGSSQLMMMGKKASVEGYREQGIGFIGEDEGTRSPSSDK